MVVMWRFLGSFDWKAESGRKEESTPRRRVISRTRSAR